MDELPPSPTSFEEEPIGEPQPVPAPPVPTRIPKPKLSAPRYAATTRGYPPWAQEIARKYLGGNVNQFILHGNVRDLVHVADDSGRTSYKNLTSFLVQDLFQPRDIILIYDRASGIQRKSLRPSNDFDLFLRGYDTRSGTNYATRGVPADPVRAFSLLDDYFRTRLRSGRKVAFIVDFAETVIPMAEAAMYSAEDRNAVVFLQRWAHDPFFLERDFSLCLIAENLSDLNQQHVQSPWTSEIHLLMPSVEERLALARWYCGGDRKEAYALYSEVPLETLAQNTAGLSLIQLRGILAETINNKSTLTYERLSENKKEKIEEASFGMLEFVETDYNMDMVAGHTEAKVHLRNAASALRKGRGDVMPMGYLVSGPVGTGKTFLVNCFAGEIGIPMVKMKNFRSQWQGQTEGNLERILNLLEAMPPVAVMIDEADAALGNRDSRGDSGVSNRVFGQIASFMSNTKHRGRIIFFLITARPDLVPVDLKRQGRAEEHLALFYPSTSEGRLELLKVMMHRTGMNIPVEDVPKILLNGERTYSGADMEALLIRSKFRAAALNENDTTVTPEILEHVVQDFIPPTYPLAVELQTLAAVLESTSREMLPESLRNMKRSDVVRRVRDLKALID